MKDLEILCSCSKRITLTPEGGPGIYLWHWCACGRGWGLQRANAAPPRYFIGNGQGCGTVWYHTPSDAREAVHLNAGVPPHGSQSGLCDRCGCRHSHKRKPLPEFACRKWKEQWAKLQPLDIALQLPLSQD